MSKSGYQMKTNSRRIQLVLLSIGLLLFVLTYLYYPYFNKNKYFEKPTVKKDFKKTIGADQITNFENIEYKGLYDFDKPFIVHAEEAYIKTNEDPDVVWMKNMRVVLYLSDERIVTITSDFGHYQKLTYDCYFENNVLATDGDTQISGSNLNLLATENVAKKG